MFSTGLENFLPFSSNLKLLSVHSFSLEKSKICNVYLKPVVQMMALVCEKVENSVGKEENAGCQCFLLFPRCFQESSSPES